MSAAPKNIVKIPNPTDVHVGSKIRMQRNLASMTQSSLGNAIGVTFQQVQKYEKGTNRVGASRLQQIAEVLNVPVSIFFDESGSTDSTLNENSQGVMDFLATKQGLDLNRSFMKIKDPKIKDKAVQLIKAIAENSLK